MTSAFRRSFAAALLLAALPAQAPPAAPPLAWQRLIGEYGTDSTTRVMIIERDGSLVARFDSTSEARLSPAGPARFQLTHTGPAHRGEIRSRLDARGRPQRVTLAD